MYLIINRIRQRAGVVYEQIVNEAQPTIISKNRTDISVKRTFFAIVLNLKIDSFRYYSGLLPINSKVLFIWSRYAGMSWYIMYCLINEQECFIPDKTRTASLLNGFKNEPFRKFIHVKILKIDLVWVENPGRNLSKTASVLYHI